MGLFVYLIVILQAPFYQTANLSEKVYVWHNSEQMASMQF